MIRKTALFFTAWMISVLSLIAQTNSPFSFIREEGGIREYQHTKNGLQVLLMEDPSAPVLTFMITYKVGSRNERLGNTGSTHILEHMMFKGTPTFNKEKGTAISAMLQNVGAMMNATTWLDRTNYFEMLPSEHLELAVKIESDRMRNLLLDENHLKSEMTVVRNEFEIGENNPEEALDKNIWATAYQAHPYHHSTIGWKSDIENVSIKGLREFYDTYYWPNNATVTIIGGFNSDQALKLIDQYFGAIPKSPHPIPEVYTVEPRQEGPRRVTVKRAGQNGLVGIAHKTPKGLHPDHAALAILDRVLTSGKNSRFYKRLIDKGLAARADVSYMPFRDEALFISYITLTPQTSHEQIEKLVLEEYEKIKAEGITLQELEAAKAQFRASAAFARDGSFGIAAQINEAIAIGDWTHFVKFQDAVQKVTLEDIRRVAATYWIEDQMTVGYFIPKTEEKKSTGSLPMNDRQASYTYRRPTALFDYPWIEDAGSAALATVPGTSATSLAKKITDKRIHSIRVLTMKTSVKDVVTLRGSFFAGTVFAPKENKALADLTVAMLDQGTKKRDKFAIAAELEKIGATVSFTNTNETVEFTARCLKNDVPTVMAIIAEELREPLFDEKTFETVKKRRMALYRQNLENTDVRALETLSQKIFPEDHPNYAVTTEQMLRDIEKTTLEDVRAFYRQYYGPRSMTIVAVGDVDSKVVEHAVKTGFSGWKGGVTFKTPKAATPVKGSETPLIVNLQDKTSTTVMIGTVTGLRQDDKDYLPLYVGTYILGGNFSARLMMTVRDNEGLTYGIRAGTRGQTFCDGMWLVNAYFGTQLVDKGIESTHRQIHLWLSDGITDDELAAKKTTITGSYKVGLSTTGRMAEQILNIAMRNAPLSYLDEYPKEVNALTTSRVNQVIRKYIRKDNLITVVAGSVKNKNQELREKE